MGDDHLCNDRVDEYRNMAGQSGSGAAGAVPVGPLLDDGGSGSVMAEMMALFAPPGRDSKRGNGVTGALLNPKPVELHPYFRRPGKDHNDEELSA